MEPGEGLEWNGKEEVRRKTPGPARVASSRAARRAWTARGIKRWPGLLLDDAIGKTGSGCFPDLPATGYYQTLRVSERSPQKSVSGVASLVSAGDDALKTCTVRFRRLAARQTVIE